MKRIKIVFVFILSFLVHGAYSQDWFQTYPSWTGTHSKSLAECYDNGYLFLSARDITGSISYSVIVKTDINGNHLWYKTVGDGIHDFYPGHMEKTNDHGLILCGMTNKYDHQAADPFLVKLNTCGELEWCKIIYTPGIYDYPIRVKQTFNGQFVLLTSYSDQNPLNRIQLYKMDSIGELLWKHNYSPDSLLFNEDGLDLSVIDNGYLITAKCYFPDSGQTGSGYERPYYIKTDTSGNDVWRLVYGSGNGYHGFPGYKTLQSQSGSFYNVGWHSNYCDTPALNQR